MDVNWDILDDIVLKSQLPDVSMECDFDELRERIAVDSMELCVFYLYCEADAWAMLLAAGFSEDIEVPGLGMLVEAVPAVAAKVAVRYAPDREWIAEGGELNT